MTDDDAKDPKPGAEPGSASEEAPTKEPTLPGLGKREATVLGVGARKHEPTVLGVAVPAPGAVAPPADAPAADAPANPAVPVVGAVGAVGARPREATILGVGDDVKPAA